MSDRIHAATRKGLFTLERGSSGRWRIAGTAFLGDHVSMLLSDTRDGTLYACQNLGHFGVKLQRSTDQGKTWKEVGVPAYPKDSGEKATKETDAEAKAPSLKQIWAMETGKAGQVWVGTMPGGLFSSEDKGDTWQLAESLWNMPERKGWFGGGADVPGIHSVCVDPTDPAKVLIGISVGGAWGTSDGGKTWEVRAKGMYAEFMPPEQRENPLMQDPHRIVQSPTDPDVMYCQHHNAAFKSVNAGRQWTEIHPQPSKFGFGVAVHPKDPDTAWFVPAVKDECRIPVDAQMVVSRTRDGGKSFEVLREGLPQEHAYDLVFRHAFDVDDTGDRLVMGSTTGALWVSEDQGDSWQTVSAHMPPVYCVRFEK